MSAGPETPRQQQKVGAGGGGGGGGCVSVFGERAQYWSECEWAANGPTSGLPGPRVTLQIDCPSVWRIGGSRRGAPRQETAETLVEQLFPPGEPPHVVRAVLSWCERACGTGAAGGGGGFAHVPVAIVGAWVEHEHVLQAPEPCRQKSCGGCVASGLSRADDSCSRNCCPRPPPPPLPRLILRCEVAVVPDDASTSGAALLLCPTSGSSRAIRCVSVTIGDSALVD